MKKSTLKISFRIQALVLATVISNSVFAQYSPGGIGRGSLFVWLNAQNTSSLTVDGSNRVSQWSDLSGKNNHFTQSTTASRPVYGAATGPGSRPALTFTSSSSQHLGNTALPNTLSFTSGVSSFAVANFASTGNWERIYDFGNGAASNNIWMGRYGNTTNFCFEGWAGSTGAQAYTTGGPVSNGTNFIYEAVQASGSAGANTAVTMVRNGTTQASSGALGSSRTYITNAVARTSNFIGRSNWAADTYFNGTMSEVLVFNTALNTTQRVLVENYLGAEWGLTVGTSRFTPPTSTTFNQNLIGIGYTSSTDNFVNNATGSGGSTDGMGFQSATNSGGFLNTAGYIMAAHNNQANTVLTNQTITGVPPSGISRFNRSWYVDKTGGNNAGTVTIKFDFNNYNGSTLPGGAVSYGILYNATNGSFTSGTNVLLSNNYTISGTTISFALTASNVADGYYTLVWSNSFVLPITFESFQVSLNNNNEAVLNWKADNDGSSPYKFLVERADFNGSFSTIGEVAGATLTGSNSYSFTDKQTPSGTSLYRIKLVQEDGYTAYTAIVRINNTSGGTDPLVVTYKTASNQVHLSSTILRGNVNLQVMSANGQKVFERNLSLNGSADVDLGNMQTGVYFLKLQIGQTNTVRKIYKN
ncbi:MAG: T9SS type A sorting domain-containing protein [Chitinophagaceae bacterium]|nr:T9SS type A sorting domain-containing protein [Chitinophagaceae bacterium]